jgi:serine phosphatase RsbU (regulator of sigma subunit)
LNYLTATLPQHAVPAHTILFREGDYGDRCYILLAGEIEIFRALGTPDEHLLAVMSPGELVGEIALLNPDRLRTASARTRSPAQLLELTRTDFEALLERQPTLAFEMVRMLSLRLRESHDASMRDVGHQLSQAYQDLQAAQAKLIEQEKLERDLALARELQQRMLPRTLPYLAGCQFGARMEPARIVGGDFFDFIPLSAETVGIVVADVCGKGMPAALYMALTRGLLRAEVSQPVSAHVALQRVNQHLLDVSEAEIFVTVVYGVLHQTTHEFTYVRAGHTVPLLVDARGEVIMVDPGLGQPLGILPDPELDEQTVTIPPGGALLLYTDGVTEARDEQGGFFGVGRLHESVRANWQAGAQALCDQLLQLVMTYQGLAPQDDDLTLVAVQVQ